MPWDAVSPLDYYQITIRNLFDQWHGFLRIQRRWGGIDHLYGY